VILRRPGHIGRGGLFLRLALPPYIAREGARTMPNTIAADYHGLHAVVTGGTGALGSAVVGDLLARGAVCHIPAFDDAELKRFEHARHEHVRITKDVNLADERAVTRFYEDIPALWASIHIAGGFAMSPIAETSLADFQRMQNMNAATCFLSCREAVKRIRATASTDGGRIVNVAARPALVPAPGMTAYAASKAAVASITRCLAEELAQEQIWVNAVVPSIMDTPANRRAMPDADHDAWPSVAGVAATVAFLASPRNAVTRGALVPVYGGS